jgi:hypothetical protein
MVFILGTGRCGSSLLHEVVARHEDTGFVSNVDDRLAFLDLKGPANGTLYRRLPPRLSRKGRPRFAPSEAYRLLGRKVSPVMARSARDLVATDVTPWLGRRLRRFFEVRASAQDAAVFTHKLTGWPRVGFLDAVFPDARFVHVVRDGRAVANSWLQMPWWGGWEGPGSWRWGPLPAAYADEWESSGRSFPLLAGLGWKLLIDAFERARLAIGPERWLELRYEDLVARPRQTLETVLTFSNLEWTPQFETGFSRQHFSGGREDAYLEDLDSDSVSALDRSLHDHLRRFDYPVPAPGAVR